MNPPIWVEKSLILAVQSRLLVLAHDHKEADLPD